MYKINNVPCGYQELFPNTEMDFVLLHKLINNEKYKNYYLNNYHKIKYIILDCSGYELGVGISDEVLIDWANRISANEIIIPDFFKDKDATLESMYSFFEKHPNNLNFKLHVVPQGKTKEELMECFNIMSRHPRVDVIGINKLWDRKNLNIETEKELHLLGLNDVSEWSYPHITEKFRSGDSRRLTQIILNKDDIWEEELTDTQISILKKLIIFN